LPILEKWKTALEDVQSILGEYEAKIIDLSERTKAIESMFNGVLNVNCGTNSTSLFGGTYNSLKFRRFDECSFLQFSLYCRPSDLPQLQAAANILFAYYEPIFPGDYNSNGKSIELK
jgi:hypothetical protein